MGGKGGIEEFALYTDYVSYKEDVTIDKQIDSIIVKASLGWKYGPISGGTEDTHSLFTRQCFCLLNQNIQDPFTEKYPIHNLFTRQC